MLQIFKPTSPSRRHLVLLKNTTLEKSSTFQHLVKGFNRNFGKNNQGRITCRHRGGGHKRVYRNISFERTQVHSGKVIGIEYDPNRSANIAAILNTKLALSFYILAPEGLELNQNITTSEKTSISLGNTLPLQNIPIGTNIHNINLKNTFKFVRSAGTVAQLIQKNTTHALVRLASGQVKTIPINVFATIGRVSNSDFHSIVSGKAGRTRWLNKRPSVRGVAKNPVDHPHGGGEGKTSGGRPSATPKGFITKGKPTVKNKKNYIF